MRHRVAIQDVAFLIGVILLAGFAAYEYSFVGSIEENSRIEFEESLILGTLIVVGILYLGWRRVREQEREIRRRVVAERRAHDLAHTDPLTGLANRRKFEQALHAAIVTPRGPNEMHALLMLDLNGFKSVNDVFGHAEGDNVIAAVADLLRPVTRDRDLVARLGGDEFAIILHHVASPDAAANVALRIVNTFSMPLAVGPNRHRIGAGIGIALLPRDGTTADELMRKADIALYRAKAEPQSAIRFFEIEMDQHIRERDLIERELSDAVGTDALRPWYQPIYDLKTGDITAFEALARWTHPVLGEVEPKRFIPVAESSALIAKVSQWLLLCAARDAVHWPAHVMLSFNISPAELRDPGLALRIMKTLADTGLPPRRLEIEITESAIVHDLEEAGALLSQLRQAGIRIAIDDFGTGYSSLYHLRHFPVDTIKIDRSFINTMSTETESAAIIRALTGLGNGLGLTVIAEGVEAKEEADVLRTQGCSQAQGFLFNRAMSAAEAAALLAPGSARAAS